MEFNEIKDEINKTIEGCNDPHITLLVTYLSTLKVGRISMAVHQLD